MGTTIREDRLLRLRDYWQTKRAGRRWPSRRDIDPCELRFTLGDLLLVDVLANPLRFRYRLTGSNIVLRVGYDLCGQGPEAIPDPRIRTRVMTAFTQVATMGEPLSESSDRTVGGVRYAYDLLVLPLSADQQRVDMLLVGQVYRESAAA